MTIIHLLTYDILKRLICDYAREHYRDQMVGYEFFTEQEVINLPFEAFICIIEIASCESIWRWSKKSKVVRRCIDVTNLMKKEAERINQSEEEWELCQ